MNNPRDLLQLLQLLHRVPLARLAAPLALAVALAAPLVALLVAAPRRAVALPIYGARSGRTCDNCHTDPSRWKNPSLAWRKCNLSCLGCHVNPTGGGLRSAPGRFYAQATLPLLFSSHRGYKDWDKRHLLSAFGKLEKDRHTRVPDSGFGSPIGGSPTMAFAKGRYAELNADPFILVGLDFRLAFWKSKGFLIFPMQLDTHLALHPMRYVTTYVSAGVLAKSKGFASTFERRPPYFIKDAFLMLHQLPYMLYARVGRFLPPFGTMLDDHTSPIRRDFELDQGILNSRVTGVELGLAPNYPYAHVAFFRPGPRDQYTFDDPDGEDLPAFGGQPGFGAAFSAGWRDLGWQLGISGMLRRRQLEDGGDTNSLSLQWAFNPWYFADAVPLTLMGELAFGTRQRPLSGETTRHFAIYSELFYTPFNGLNVKLKYDMSDYDTEVQGDHYHRLTFGFDLFVLPKMSVHWQLRMRIAAAGVDQRVATGLFWMLRAWY